MQWKYFYFFIFSKTIKINLELTVEQNQENNIFLNNYRGFYSIKRYICIN